MPHNSQLSRRERQIMDAIYARGRSSVNQVAGDLPDPPSPTAVRTLLNILVEKGHLRQTRSGRENVYLPTRPRRREGQTAMRRVVETFFDGSLEKALAAHLADPKAQLGDDELQNLKEMIEKRSG